MTKKKRGHPDIEEVLARPWCFYCERDFDDLKILINHQKAKHFKCDRCGRRLNTAGGLNVHMNQVHKETLGAIENSLPNRSGLDVEIFGMEGIPDDIVQQHNQRVLTQFHQAEAERRAVTGNPVSGAPVSNGVKKPKFESPADLKKRLAEHKAAKLVAEQNGGGSSGANTPTPTLSTPTTTLPSPQGAAPAYPGYQQPYPAPPSATTFSGTLPYAQPGVPVYQNSTYAAPPAGFLQSPPPQPYQQAFPPPPQSSLQQQPFPTPSAFSPPPFASNPQFSKPGYQVQVPQNGYTGQVGAPRAYHSASPASQFPQQQRTHSPTPNGVQRTGTVNLPSAPGLPQRPAVSVPQVNAAQFQQMHQGQMPTQHKFPIPQPHEDYNPAIPQVGMPRNLSIDGAVSSLDDLICSASKQADEAAIHGKTIPPKSSTPLRFTEPKDDTGEAKINPKKDSKEKANRPTRLVYSDNEISPEEKMAALYPFSKTHTTISA